MVGHVSRQFILSPNEFIYHALDLPDEVCLNNRRSAAQVRLGRLYRSGVDPRTQYLPESRPLAAASVMLLSSRPRSPPRPRRHAGWPSPHRGRALRHCSTVARPSSEHSLASRPHTRSFQSTETDEATRWLTRLGRNHRAAAAFTAPRQPVRSSMHSRDGCRSG